MLADGCIWKYWAKQVKHSSSSKVQAGTEIYFQVELPGRCGTRPGSAAPRTSRVGERGGKKRKEKGAAIPQAAGNLKGPRQAKSIFACD